MDLDKKLKRVSMSLSKILRHQAVNRNLNMDQGGWIKLDEIMNSKEFDDFSQLEGMSIPRDIFLSKEVYADVKNDIE